MNINILLKNKERERERKQKREMIKKIISIFKIEIPVTAFIYATNALHIIYLKR